MQTSNPKSETKSPSYAIRRATAADMPAIRRIFNEAVRNSTAVFIEKDVDEDWERAWIDAHGDNSPGLVAEIDGEVAGWASITNFSARSGYRFSKEVSVYIDSAHRRRGIGRALAVEAERIARELGMHSLMALIERSNEASVEMFERLGYTRAGLLREAGYKFNLWLDVAYYQKILSET